MVVSAAPVAAATPGVRWRTGGAPTPLCGWPLPHTWKLSLARAAGLVSSAASSRLPPPRLPFLSSGCAPRPCHVVPPSTADHPLTERLNPFPPLPMASRIIAQVVVVAGTYAVRAFAEAYRQALANGAAGSAGRAWASIT